MLRPQSLLPDLENAAILGFSFLKFILKREGNGQRVAAIESVRVVATKHLGLNVNDSTQLRLSLPNACLLFIQHKAQDWSAPPTYQNPICHEPFLEFG